LSGYKKEATELYLGEFPSLNMPTFNGFPAGKTRLTPIPGPFFADLLPEIDHLGELKVTLYVFWQLDRREGTFRFLRRADFTGDERFIQGLGATREEAEAALDEALQRAAGRGTLLKIVPLPEAGAGAFYFLNSPKGRAAVEAIRSGKWRPSVEAQPPVELGQERPNIFRLYEENLGPLTPMIAEALRDAEESYPLEWIEDAIRIAVEINKRSWRYVNAILSRWREEGRDEQDGRDTEKDGRSFLEGKYSEFLEH
jgi:DnaD/phage-associated family protein